MSLRAMAASVTANASLAPTRPQMRRRVLLVTFHYPPDNSSSGTLRPLKFTKYLPDAGWDCSVLTVPVECYPSTDPALASQIPRGVSVYRARCADTKTAFSVRGRYPSFLAVPDRYISWLPFAVRAGARIVRSERVDVLLSTSPVPTTHMIAATLRSITGCPWVADFRDPWVETEGSEAHGRLRQAVELWMERQVVQRADRIVVTTTEFGEWLRARYGDGIGRKTQAIYNGYDEEDFAGLEPPAGETGTFALLHAGLLDPGYRDPVPLFEAIRRCLDRGALRSDFRLRILGGGQYAASGALARVVTELRLVENVELLARLPYRRTLTALMASPALLLMQGSEARTLIPAKAFEYLRAGRPMLALAPADSATARLIRGFDGCFAADPADPADIARQLCALASAWERGLRSVRHSEDDLVRYSRSSAARQLAEVLEQACRTSVSSHA